MDDQTHPTANPAAPPRNKADILERVVRERQALAEAVAGIDEARLAAPGPDGGWSAKDHLGHVVAWEQLLTATLIGQPVAPLLHGVPEDTYRGEDIDRLNALIQERNRDRAPAAILAEFRRSGADLMAALDRVDDADLDRPFPPDHPEGRTLLDRIEDDSYGHYPEHREAIVALTAA